MLGGGGGTFGCVLVFPAHWGGGWMFWRLSLVGFLGHYFEGV